MKHQYWLKIRYKDEHERWELTKGKFVNEEAALKAYEARGKALHFEVTEVKPHEQLEFGLKYTPQPTKDYDQLWGVKGYYEDDDGNDIRDRD